MLRIAVFSDNTANQINGAAEVTRQIRAALTRMGVVSSLFCPSEPCEQESLESQPIVAHSFPWKMYPECRIALPFSMNQIKRFVELCPSLVVITTPFSVGLTGLLLAKLTRTPVVSFFLTDFASIGHYYGIHRLDSTFWRIQQFFARQSSSVYVPSCFARNLLAANGIHNTQVFELGTSSHFFRPRGRQEMKLLAGSWRDETVNLLYVGRFAEDKNIESLISAAALLPHVRLNIVGDGPLARRTVCRLPRNISALGYLRGECLAQMYRSCDGFVMPSIEEVGGMAIVEALASKIPTLAFAGKATTELVDNGNNGILFGSTGDLPFVLKEFSHHKLLQTLSRNISHTDVRVGPWVRLARDLVACASGTALPKGTQRDLFEYLVGKMAPTNLVGPD